jgi:glucose-6-phosphate isomerase
MTRTRCDQTPAWGQLTALFGGKAAQTLAKQLQQADMPWRNRALVVDAPHIHADLRKSACDQASFDALMALIDQCGVAEHRAQMFSGGVANPTEGRQVMHWLTRQPAEVLQRIVLGSNPLVVGEFVKVVATKTGAMPLPQAAADVLRVREGFFAYTEGVRADSAAGKVTDVVNIGIGGSDLGPCMATQALAQFAVGGPRVHFVSNVDPFAMEQALKGAKPQTTRFIVQSKTFSTIETRLNAQAAIAWLMAGGVSDVSSHLCGVTMNAKAAAEMGCGTVLGMWDWVGGRYSVWSSIGAPLAIAVGKNHFNAFLQGAAEMDAHFCHAPAAQNLPMMLAAQDLLYRNFLGHRSRSVAPYAQALARLPAYLQQLEMESNGKRVDAAGQAVPFDTSAVVWGEAGTNGQHAYFQQLHQGTEVVPVEFIAVKKPMASGSQAQAQHRTLLANAIAQAQAFMVGKADAGGHKHFDGGRPSNFLLLDALTPASLGALIALYEHRVFVAGSVWGLNSFDQFGVELGKVLATDVERRMASGDLSGLDASTADLIAKVTQ